MPAHTISTHAVLRYVERVMGIDLDQIRRDMKAADPAAVFADGAVLAHMEKHGKIVVEKVRKHMMTPLVLAAIRSGATRVRSEGWWFIIEEKTVVTVVSERNPYRRSHRSKPKYQHGRRPDHYEHE
jgi:hypothetical protein